MADDDIKTDDAPASDAGSVTVASNADKVEPAGIHTQGGGGTAIASTEDVADV